MNQPVYQFKDHENYFVRLGNIIQKLIKDPNDLNSVITVRKKDGKVLGWDIEGSEFRFKHWDSYLDVDELAQVNENGWFLKSFSYHLQPSVNMMESYRVDLDNFSLHANPDERLQWKDHLMYPDDIDLKINQYNLFVAICVAMKYLQSEEYPLDNQYSQEYNHQITTANGGI
jgi:hypothetical protein